MVNTQIKRSALIVILCAGLIAASVAIVFRLSIEQALALLPVRLNSIISAFAVGWAFAVAGTLNYRPQQVIWHLRGFSVVTIGAATYLYLHFNLTPISLTILATMVVCVVAYGVSSLLLREYRLGTFTLAVGLALLTAIWVYVYGLASVASGPTRDTALWLMGDLGPTQSWSSLLLLLFSLLLTVWSRLRQQRQFAAIALFGLASGVAGPVLFLSWLVPWWLHSAGFTVNRRSIWLSGIVGGSALLAAESFGSVLLGGFQAPTAFLINLTAIPFILAWYSARLLRTFPSHNRRLLELLLILLAVIIILIALFQLHRFIGVLA